MKTNYPSLTILGTSPQGVGNYLCQFVIIYTKNEWNNEEKGDLQGEELRESYPTKNGCWGSLLSGFEQHLPLDLVITCKKQQAKLAGNAAKHTQNVTKNFCFYT